MGGLQATDLRQDSASLAKLTERIKGICGPVVEMHEGAEDKPNFGPFLDVCVKSWPITVDGMSKRAYAFSGCDIVSPC